MINKNGFFNENFPSDNKKGTDSKNQEKLYSNSSDSLTQNSNKNNNNNLSSMNRSPFNSQNQSSAGPRQSSPAKGALLSAKNKLISNTENQKKQQNIVEQFPQGNSSIVTNLTGDNNKQQKQQNTNFEAQSMVNCQNNLGAEDSFQKLYSKELDLDEDEVPLILHELNDSAIHFINKEQYDRALSLLQKAQTLLDRLMFQKNASDKFLIHSTMHNMALCFQKMGALEECSLCLDACLNQLSSPYLENICKSNPSRKLKRLRYECKVHMQVCALLSQLNRHQEALCHAKRSVQISQYMINDLLELCEKLNQKIVLAKKREQVAQELIVKGDLPLQPGQEDDQRDNNFEQKLNKSDLIYFDEQVSMLERTAHKFYPIIQEVAKRMIKHKEEYKSTLNQDKEKQKARNVQNYSDSDLQSNLGNAQDQIYENKSQYQSDWILQQAKEFKAQEKNKQVANSINMRVLLGYLNQSEWMFLLNIGNIMQITPLTIYDLNSTSNIEIEMARDSIIEKISFLAVSYFCVSTELRFLVNLKDNPHVDPVQVRAESEFWHGKALEISCTFLPSESPLVSHIYSSYKKHHAPVNQVIQEDNIQNEDNLKLKVIRPLQGIDQAKHQPIIRNNQNMNISLSPLNLSPNNYIKKQIEQQLLNENNAQIKHSVYNQKPSNANSAELNQIKIISLQNQKGISQQINKDNQEILKVPDEKHDLNNKDNSQKIKKQIFEDENLNIANQLQQTFSPQNQDLLEKDLLLKQPNNQTKLLMDNSNQLKNQHQAADSKNKLQNLNQNAQEKLIELLWQDKCQEDDSFIFKDDGSISQIDAVEGEQISMSPTNNDQALAYNIKSNLNMNEDCDAVGGMMQGQVQDLFLHSHDHSNSGKQRIRGAIENKNDQIQNKQNQNKKHENLYVNQGQLQEQQVNENEKMVKTQQINKIKQTLSVQINDNKNNKELNKEIKVTEEDQKKIGILNNDIQYKNKKQHAEENDGENITQKNQDKNKFSILAGELQDLSSIKKEYKEETFHQNFDNLMNQSVSTNSQNIKESKMFHVGVNKDKGFITIPNNEQQDPINQQEEIKKIQNKNEQTSKSLQKIEKTQQLKFIQQRFLQDTVIDENLLQKDSTCQQQNLVQKHQRTVKKQMLIRKI